MTGWKDKQKKLKPLGHYCNTKNTQRITQKMWVTCPPWELKRNSLAFLAFSLLRNQFPVSSFAIHHRAPLISNLNNLKPQCRIPNCIYDKKKKGKYHQRMNNICIIIPFRVKGKVQPFLIASLLSIAELHELKAVEPKSNESSKKSQIRKQYENGVVAAAARGAVSFF